MKISSLVLIASLYCATLHGGDTKFEDSPAGLTIDMAALMKPYENRARETIGEFDKALKKPNGRTLYLVTRIYEGEFYEQVFVRITKKKKDIYFGVIASSPMGRVKYNEGDQVEVPEARIFDWLIVNKDGTEEGNLQGKAIDLLQVGVATFISRWQPVAGEFKEFEVVSVRNPKTQQEITDIVPDEVIESVRAHVEAKASGQPATDDKEKFGYTLVRYPSWEIITEDN